MAKIKQCGIATNANSVHALEAITTQAEALKPSDAPVSTTPRQKPIKANFRHLHTQLNKDYPEARKAVSFRSCLLHNNSDKNSLMHYIENEPKWLTILQCSLIDPDTGEVVGHENIQTNNHKASNGRKIKCLDKWCAVFQPLYKARKVSLFFYTLTQAEKASLTIAQAIDILKKRGERNGYPILGYIWTLEISRKGHIHYHIGVAIDRMTISEGKLPAWLKLNKVWERRTQVAFVRKNIRHYMAKYFAKDSTRISGKRSYGVSINKQYKHIKLAP